MKVMNSNGKKIYRPKKGHKVKFVNSDRLYSEIVVAEDDNRQVEEVSAKGGE